MAAAPKDREYTALIRTFNSASTLGATLDSLAKQAPSPAAVVVVDSGSTDGTLEKVPPGAKVHHYVGDTFDYSSALNQGLQLVDTDYVLIISSHTLLTNPDATSRALDLLDSNPLLGAAYFDFGVGDLEHTIIDASNFDGFNGLWNTCSLIRVDLLRSRPFVQGLPACEDQEWAAWLIRHKSMMTARISGGGMQNPFNSRRITLSRLRKVLWEQVAVFHFVRGDSPVEIFAAAVKPGGGYSWRRRTFQCMVAARLALFQKSPSGHPVP